MALNITPRTKEGPVPNIIVDRRLFLTADKDELVDPDDPRAAFLWANTGDEVTAEEAERVGYTDGTPAADPDAEVKEVDAVEDKAVAEPETDKAAAAPKRKRGGG